MSVCLMTVISGMERFAYKGVASNLITYLTDVVKMSNSSAAKTVNSWCGFTSMVPLLIAPFADSYWDRYYTIVASSLIYVAVSTNHLSFLSFFFCCWSLITSVFSSVTLKYFFWSVNYVR